MDLREQLLQITEQLLPDESLFIVDIKISSKINGKVSVLLYGDNGVSIYQCASVSRQLGGIIEEQNMIEAAYTLEVSSPGIDHPLMHIRQYKANIGRRLEIMLADSTKPIKGELKEVFEDKILIAKEEKVKKKTEIEDIEVLLSNITEAKVLVSFK